MTEREPFVLAIVAVRNERRFIGACLDHFLAHDVEVHVIDNGSTDETMDIVGGHLGHGVTSETLPYLGHFSLNQQLKAKAAAAARRNPDWVISADADEIRLPPRSDQTLRGAIATVDAGGFNAVNFLEFSFVPTVEEPDHDHPEYQSTMRSYYYYSPWYPAHVKAWKHRELTDADLTRWGGHSIVAEGLRISPVDFSFRHYHFLSVPHLLEKYRGRSFDPAESSLGWHGWRDGIDASRVRLASSRELETYTSDDELAVDHPVTTKLPPFVIPDPTGPPPVR